MLGLMNQARPWTKLATFALLLRDVVATRGIGFERLVGGAEQGPAWGPASYPIAPNLTNLLSVQRRRAGEAHGERESDREMIGVQRPHRPGVDEITPERFQGSLLGTAPELLDRCSDAERPTRPACVTHGVVLPFV